MKPGLKLIECGETRRDDAGLELELNPGFLFLEGGDYGPIKAHECFLCRDEAMEGYQFHCASYLEFISVSN